MSNLGYNCTVCGKWHAFTPYVMAYRFEHLLHRCECGARHDIYNHEASYVDPLDSGITEWFEGVEPDTEGYYHIRFPNGTEANRNWWWDGSAFLYSKGSPVRLAFNCIGAWRGMKRKPQ